VHDCAVFGIPDEEFGEALMAVVEPQAGVTLDIADIRARHLESSTAVILSAKHAQSPIDPARLEKTVSADSLPAIPAEATLADALSAMILHDTDRLRVNRNGEVLGLLTLPKLLEIAAEPTG